MSAVDVRLEARAFVMTRYAHLAVASFRYVSDALIFLSKPNTNDYLLVAKGAWSEFIQLENSEDLIEQVSATAHEGCWMRIERREKNAAGGVTGAPRGGES